MPPLETYIYHERQSAALCGQHALNNLVQSAAFSPGQLADAAAELDRREMAFLAENTEGGTSNRDYLERAREGSGNVDDAGNFSIQVLRLVLEQRFDRSLPSVQGEEMKGKGEDLTTNEGFILNRSNHWLAIRLVAGSFWVLDSLKERPEIISHFRLAAEIEAYTAQGYCVFACAGGPLPTQPKELWELERGRAEYWWKEADLRAAGRGEKGAKGNIGRLDTDVWRNLGSGTRLDGGGAKSSAPAPAAADVVDLTGLSEDEQMALALSASLAPAPAPAAEVKPEPPAGDAAVRIQIRLPDGKRVVRRFLSAAAVEEIYAFVEGEAGGRVALKAFFPPRDIGHLRSETVEGAKLAGEALTAAKL